MRLFLGLFEITATEQHLTPRVNWESNSAVKFLERPFEWFRSIFVFNHDIENQEFVSRVCVFVLACVSRETGACECVCVFQNSKSAAIILPIVVTNILCLFYVRTELSEAVAAIPLFTTL